MSVKASMTESLMVALTVIMSQKALRTVDVELGITEGFNDGFEDVNEGSQNL